MNTHTIKSILPAGAFALAVIAPLYGSSITTAIYSDDFNRTGSLHGSSPVISPEAPSWATNASWISSSNLTTDGSKATVPMQPGGANVSSNACLPADITVNSGIYELTITYAAAWWGTNSWVAFGFATSSAGTDSAFFSNAIGMTTYNRGADNWDRPASVTIYAAGATNPPVGSIPGVNRAGGTSLTVKITLDTYATSGNLTVTTLNASTEEEEPAVRSVVGTLTPAQINSIQAIKIGAYQGQPGTFDNLSFTVTVPAPARKSARRDDFPPTTAEPVLFIRTTADGKPEGRLLFQPKRLLRAYAFNPDREFPVTDFALEGRKIVHVGREPIPHWTKRDLVSPEKTDTHGQPHADGKRYILYGGHRDRQLHFDYETDEPWRGPTPRDQSANLPRLHRKIRNHEPIVLTILGDSISQGCDATAWSNVPPMLPPYRDLLAQAIRQASGANVALRNLAVGGTGASWGVKQTGAVAKTKPDLLVIAFGMNDSSARRPDKTFIQDIQAIMDGVRTDSPDTEFLLVSGMTPNPHWAHSHLEYLETYHKGLLKLAAPHVAVGDVRSTWLYILDRKSFFDLTGNGINHPNDYGHRLYANVLARTTLGNAFIKNNLH